MHFKTASTIDLIHKRIILRKEVVVRESVGTYLGITSSGIEALCFMVTTALLLTLISGSAESAEIVRRQNVTVDGIQEAEQSLAHAYIAVRDAERAGANVSSLLSLLNEGADLLSQAALAYRIGDHEEASQLSDLSSYIADSTLDEAARLKLEAEQASIKRAWLYSFTSAIAVSAVCVASLVGYRYFKRWYFDRLLRMKPAVEQK